MSLLCIFNPVPFELSTSLHACAHTLLLISHLYSCLSPSVLPSLFFVLSPHTSPFTPLTLPLLCTLPTPSSSPSLSPSPLPPLPLPLPLPSHLSPSLYPSPLTPLPLLLPCSEAFAINRARNAKDLNAAHNTATPDCDFYAQVVDALG